MTKNIAVIRGDGIGPEIVNEALRVLDKIAELYGHTFHYTDFDMGGCEYLESRIDATEYGELLPTVDDAVCGLISILDALNTGDNDRFHLETLHHSKQEILRILERGGKIDRTVEYAVDDEDEEYEQYHGFSMRM